MPSNEQFDFVFTTEEENPQLQAAAAAVPAPVELDKPKDEIIPEIPEVKPTELEDLKGFSDAALLALSYQKTDGILPEDLEIKKDLTPKELKELIREASIKMDAAEEEKRLQEKEESERARLNEKGLTDSHYAYLQQILNGGDPQVVSRVAQYRSWADAELETEEDFDAAVRAGLKIKYGTGTDAAKMIDSYIKNDLKESEALEAAAKEQQAYIAQVADYLEKQDQERVKVVKKQQEDSEKQFASDVEKQLQSDIYGLKLKKSEIPEYVEYMTKKNVTIDVDIPGGGKQRIKVTQEEADKRRDAADIRKRVYEAIQRKTGYDKIVNKLVDTANTTSTDKYLKSIKSIEEQTSLPQPKGDVYMTLEI